MPIRRNDFICLRGVLQNNVFITDNQEIEYIGNKDITYTGECYALFLRTPKNYFLKRVVPIN